jgi:threonine synthase
MTAGAVEPRSYATHLECSWTAERHPAGQLHGLSRAGRPLLVRYDLPALAASVDRESIERRPPGLWRWRELLPLQGAGEIVSLGEVETPLVPLPRLARRLGAGEILVKDEGRLPTGSFKARGIAVAVSMAQALGVTRIAMPTNGNAGAALAAYATRAGIESFVFCPADTPEINVREIALQGAKVFRVDGLIHDCGRLVAQGAATMGWFDMATLKEPYRIEGKKTMAYELAEQMEWEWPDWIVYPTGGGTGMVGMWKAFEEIERLGWVAPGRRPRMVSVQAEGCAPIVRAFDRGEEAAAAWENPTTVADGLRVPRAIGDFLILRAVRESGGTALAVPDAAMIDGMLELGATEGISAAPEGGAALAAIRTLVANGSIAPRDRVVLFNTGGALKYLDALP